MTTTRDKPEFYVPQDRLVDPDICNGRDVRRVTGRIQAVHLFQRGQHVVMGYRLAICAGFHSWLCRHTCAAARSIYRNF